MLFVGGNGSAALSGLADQLRKNELDTGAGLQVYLAHVARVPEGIAPGLRPDREPMRHAAHGDRLH